jgi:hypothetical protein
MNKISGQNNQNQKMDHSSRAKQAGKAPSIISKFWHWQEHLNGLIVICVVNSERWGDCEAKKTTRFPFPLSAKSHTKLLNYKIPEAEHYLPKFETLGFTANVKPRKHSSGSGPKSRKFDSSLGFSPEE